MELMKLGLLFFIIKLLNMMAVNCQTPRKSKIDYRLKPIKGITEVRSRVGSVPTDDVVRSTEEYLAHCKRGIEESRQGENHYFVMRNDDLVGAQKEYIVEIGENRWDVSFELLTAVECPTSPPLYISVEDSSDERGAKMILLIFKHTDSIPNIKDVMGYQMVFVENITEAFSDEIKAWSLDHLENSVLDTDELSEKERFLICEKAIGVASKMNVTFLESTSPRASRYYILRRHDACEQTSVVQGIVQAFRCRTNPEIYVHVNYEKYAGLSLWFIMEESKDRPVFEFVGYQVKAFLDIIRILTETVTQLNPDQSEKSALDFDSLTEEERREMCVKAVTTVFDGHVDILDNLETKTSRFYALHETEGAEIDDDDIVQAVRCPTNPAVYIHVSERECDGNILWVLVRKHDFSRLSTWMVV